jgi:hypothetical protein
VVLVCALVVAMGGGFAVDTTFADEPVGTFELSNSKTQRVRSLLATAQQPDSWWRYDAPEGKVFLVVLMEVKPTYAVDPETGIKGAQMPKETVYAEGADWKVGAVGSLSPSGRFVPLDSYFMVRFNEDLPETMFIDFVFVVPGNAKSATVHAADVRVEAKLDQPVLPRFDWRDAMDVAIVRAEKVEPPQRSTGVYDDLANRDHVWKVRYGEAEPSLVAVTFRVAPRRGHAEPGFQPGAFLVDSLDFRLAYGGQTHVRGICSISGPDRAEALESETHSFTRAADGEVEAKEFTFVYPLYEPATKATLLYREGPIGEVEFGEAEIEEGAAAP